MNGGDEERAMVAVLRYQSCALRPLFPDSDALRPESTERSSASEGQMQTPSALFVRVALAAALAVLASVASGGARAADDCLAKPDRPSPPGTHWFYHLDRANHRQCWYLGGESATAHKARATKPSDRSNAQPVAASDAEPSPPPAAPAIAPGGSQADLSSYWLGVPTSPSADDRISASSPRAADDAAPPSGVPDATVDEISPALAVAAPAAPVPAAPVTLEEMLALLAAALALAAIVVRALFGLSRMTRRRDRGAARDLPPALARAVAAGRADIPRVAASTPRDEPVQAPLQPEPPDDLEATLRRLLHDWERVAA
jgi:hypothetical protein